MLKLIVAVLAARHHHERMCNHVIVQYDILHQQANETCGSIRPLLRTYMEQVRELCDELYSS